MRRKTPGAWARQALGVAVTSLFIVSCADRAVSDMELAEVFRENRELFDACFLQFQRQGIVCPDKSDPGFCQIRNSAELSERMSRKVGVKGVYVESKNGVWSLWFPVRTYGDLSTNNFTRGFVYSPKPLSPVTQDTLGEFEKGYFYRPIEDGWYIYLVR